MYTPLNANVYNAAFIGAFAGMTASMRIPVNASPPAYSASAQAAGAWAESFDTVWAGLSATPTQLEAIESSSSATWDGRTPPNNVIAHLAASYTPQVTALIASITASTAYLSTNVSPVVQTTYFVNSVTGNDTYSGATTLRPLKTIGELNNRLKQNVTASPIAVTLETDFGSTDPLFLDDFNGTLSITGTRTTVRSGTITGFTAVNRATNSETRITDAAVADWTPDLGLGTGRRVRNTTAGPNLNSIVYVAANVGAGVASTDVPYTAASPPVQGVFSPGDTYVVEKLSTITIKTLNASGKVTNPPFAGVTFKDLDFQGFPLGVAMTGNAFTAYVGCHFFPVALVTGDALTVTFSKCCGFRGVGCLNGIADIQSGLWGNNPNDQSGISIAGQYGFARIDFDATCWGSAIKLKTGGCAIGVAAAFHAPLLNGSGAGLQIGVGALHIENLPQCSVNLYNLEQLTHALYGGSNAEAGVAVGTGSVFSYQLPLPTITGAGGDFKLGAGGRERAFNEAAGAYTAPIAPTWANVGIATPAGFGGNAHDVSSDAHLMLFV